MKVQIFYFSGTGNTWWVAHEIGKQLEENGHHVRIASIEAPEIAGVDKVKSLIDDADIIGMGTPVHGSCAPPIAMDFINNLPEVKDNKPIFTFCTQMIASGDGAYFYHKIMVEKGYEHRWSAHFFMPNNLLLTKNPRSISDSKKEKALKREQKRITKLIKKIENNSTMWVGKGLGQITGLSQRPYYEKELAKWSKNLKVDPIQCNLCKLCTNLCPVGNLIEIDAKIVPQSKCQLCFRCINNCPQHAIYIMKNPYGHKASMYSGPTSDFKALFLRRDFK